MESFYLVISAADGLLVADGLHRTNATLHLLTQVRFGRWFRWEIASLGAAVEAPYPLFFSTSTILDLGPVFLKVGGHLLLDDFKRTYWGVSGGVGIAIRIYRGLYFDLGAGTTFWPGVDSVFPAEGNLGVRYGF